MTLDDLKIGQSGTIARVGGEGALRVRLLDMGLIPGTKVLLQKVAPMGDPIQIHHGMIGALNGAGFLVYGYAGEIAHMLIGAGKGVEKGGFAAVLVAG